MCDAPIYQPKCMFCNTYLKHLHKSWYWVTELPKDNHGSRWNAVCEKCWNERKEEVSEKKKEWECYHTEISYGGRYYNRGKTIHLWKGKEVSFGIYMKKRFGTIEHAIGLEKWM